ncbi:hypothetical protein O7627_11970 [Solwaraspora sp. WMMD1047]|uniref:hypothetical protein n=1 Tax=Solwaraspora sp. WMMD1047 TaxID=3016102 RepID=UPI0024159C26|nr:hypothetical protein [Solwaraspora sp. WMMD1047]MDG4830016.1 hypothetical protein [Solwaraspora sp. WMMD1047]
MRVRVTLQVAPSDRPEGRIPADRLRKEANRILEALLLAEEAGDLENVSTETDASESSITAEAAIPPATDIEVASELLTSLLLEAAVAPDGDAQVACQLTYEVRGSETEVLE